jgi:glutamine synthetase
MDKATSRGMTFMAGVEPEFHLINADGSAISDSRDTQEKPCYDQAAIMRRYEVIARRLLHHGRPRLVALSKRPRGRQRPVRDQLELQ